MLNRGTMLAYTTIGNFICHVPIFSIHHRSLQERSWEALVFALAYDLN